MDWDEAVEEAKDEMGISGFTHNWEDVLETARKIISSEASRIARDEHLFYLNSQEWKLKRERILSRDNYQCQDCLKVISIILKEFDLVLKRFNVKEINYKRSATEVHHLTYETLHTSQEENDCISLCGTCHTIRHKMVSESVKWLIEQRERNIFLGLYYTFLKDPEVIKEQLKQHKEFIDSITERIKFGDKNGT
jgi:5-methylcytosine-specific restriction endonuclease McrA